MKTGQILPARLVTGALVGKLARAKARLTLAHLRITQCEICFPNSVCRRWRVAVTSSAGGGAVISSLALGRPVAGPAWTAAIRPTGPGQHSSSSHSLSMSASGSWGNVRFCMA